MADTKDFQVRIVTTADTSGIRETDKALDDLDAKRKQVSQEPEPGSLGREAFPARAAAAQRKARDLGFDTSEELSKAEKLAAINSQQQVIAETKLELTKAQIAGDEAQVAILSNELKIRTATLGVMRSQVLTTEGLAAINAAEETALASLATKSQGLASAVGLAGANLGRARAEAIILTRELATGVPTTRTLSSLLGSLGYSIAGAAVAGIGLNKIISELAEQQNKVSRELDEQQSKVVSLAEKWRTAAKAALTQEDVQRVAESGIEEIDKIRQRIRELSTTDLPQMQKILDALAVGFKNAFTFGGIRDAKDAIGPYQTLLNELAKGLDQTSQQLIEQKRRAIEAAKATEESLKSLEAKDAISAIKELTDELTKLRAQQDAVDISTEAGILKYIELGKQIEIVGRKLQVVNQVEKDRVEFQKVLSQLSDTATTKSEEQASKAQQLSENIKRITDELRAAGVEAGTLSEMFAQGEKIAGAEGARVRDLVKELANAQLQAKKGAAEATQNASAQVKAVLANEEAARKARAAGDERSAELYEKSAEAFKRGIKSPEQAAELENIRKLQEEAKTKQPLGKQAGVGESQALVDQIEANRKAFEKLTQQIDATTAAEKAAEEKKTTAPSLSPDEAEAARRKSIEETKKASEAAEQKRREEIEQTRLKGGEAESEREKRIQEEQRRQVPAKQPETISLSQDIKQMTNWMQKLYQLWT